jgi:hypothetical protein
MANRDLVLVKSIQLSIQTRTTSHLTQICKPVFREMTRIKSKIELHRIYVRHNYHATVFLICMQQCSGGINEVFSRLHNGRILWQF